MTGAKTNNQRTPRETISAPPKASARKVTKSGTSRTKNKPTLPDRQKDRLHESNILFHHHPAATFLMNLQNKKILDVNLSALPITGFSKKEVIGKTVDDLNLFPDPEEKKTALKKLIKQSYLENHKLRIRHKDGKIFNGLFTAEIIKRRSKNYLLAILTDDIPHKSAEKTKTEKEEKYRTILETTEEGYYEIDVAGNFTFFNDPVCKLLGYSRKELMGMNNRNYTDKDTAKKVFQAFNKVYRTGEPTKEFDWQIIRKDGTRRCIEQSAALIKDGSGKPAGFRGIFHDITERKQTEELLKKSEEQYRLLADHVKDQVWLMDMNFKIEYTSPSAEKLLGYTLDELRQITVDKLLSPSSHERAMRIAAEELPRACSDPAYSMNKLVELELINKNGQILFMECAFSFIRDENGAPLSILGEGRDITERKKIEDSLRKSEENFRHSLDESPMGVRIVAPDGETLYANKAILEIYGYQSLDELREIPLHKRYTPESMADFKLREEQRLDEAAVHLEYEISIVRKDGEIRHVHALRKEIFWNGRKQYQIIYQDITERRKAEEKLQETMNSLRKAIKTTIQVLGIASEARDPYTAGHQRRVADLARAIATEMNLPHDVIEGIRMAGAIHDIGKISIPSEILCKPTMLTDLEFSLVKSHCRHSYDIVKDVESPWPLADIVYQHHERIDGSGYPQKLKKDDILIEARILAVADVVEAIMSYRPYRPALGIDIALTEIEHNAGILYDSRAAKSCLKLFRENKFKLE
ncbi:MAG: PAS domain S-box protein [Smithella sp.]|nr:PAS domain S-box protein [Smithella sp.]